eukprot:s1676_g15.t1
MTLSVVKASESETCRGGLASVITALMTYYHNETSHGIPVKVGENYELLFVPHVVFLSDHEGVRACMGCKGSAGFKPCIKCSNIVSSGRASDLPSHEDISCVEVSRFKRQTQEDVEDIVNVLRAQTSKKRREEAEAADRLISLQQQHMQAFFAAHTKDVCRPKMHYQLHLKEQMDLWKKSIDCFVCERKHRQYKTICAGKLTCSQQSFARSALLELCSQELATPLSADKLNTVFASKAEVSCALTNLLGAKGPVRVASALEHRSIRYGHGLFLTLSNGLAAEVVSAVHTGHEFCLLLDMLKPIGGRINPGRTQWMRPAPGDNSRALLPVTPSLDSECAQCMYVRHDNNTLWLLQ